MVPEPEVPSPPTAESYWVTPSLLAGKYPGARREIEARTKVRALVEAGVRTFVDLTEDGELLPYAHLLPAGVLHHRIPVRDITCPSLQVKEAVELIDLRSRVGVVYVHCWGGCGRTGVILGCYLVNCGATADAALARVDELTRVLWAKPCPETSD